MNSADILIVTPKTKGELTQEFIIISTGDDNTKTATKVQFQSVDPDLDQLGNNWRIGTVQKFDKDGKSIAFTDDAEYDNAERNMDFFIENCDDQIEKFLRSGSNGDHKIISLTDDSEDFGETDEEYDRSTMDLEDQFDKAINESISVKVTFSDGNHLTTSINADLEGAKQYYLGKTFNLGSGENDKMAKAVKVELLESIDPPQNQTTYDLLRKSYSSNNMIEVILTDGSLKVSPSMARDMIKFIDSEGGDEEGYLRDMLNGTKDEFKDVAKLTVHYEHGLNPDDPILKGDFGTSIQDVPEVITEPVEANADAQFESEDLDLNHVQIFKVNPDKAIARIILPDGRQLIGVKVTKNAFGGGVEVSFPTDPGDPEGMKAIYGGVDIAKAKKDIISKFLQSSN